MEDRDLLREYVQTQSPEAFAQLVRRHLNLVYSAALRITRQPPMAEDVAQTVFIRLAQKARNLRDLDALPGWLYRCACRAAFTAMRGERRRRERETAALHMAEISGTPDAAWERVAPLLDEAMGRLSDTEQNVILRRFFEGRSLREVGESLGLSEDAAQKRVERAVEKLRADFAAQGAVVPALLFLPALAKHSVADAPVHLAPKIAATSASVSLAGGTLFQLLLAMSKTKIIAGLLVVAVAAALVPIVLTMTREKPAPPASVPRAPATVSPPAAVRVATPPARPARVELPVAPPSTNFAVETPAPAAPARRTPPTPQEVQSITNNLRQFSSAASQYMVEQGVTQAAYDDIVGTTTEAYLRPPTPVADEDYTQLIIYQTQSEISITTSDGTAITFSQ